LLLQQRYFQTTQANTTHEIANVSTFALLLLILPPPACRDLTDALEELKSTALEVRLKEREATRAAEDVKVQLKEVTRKGGADGEEEDARVEKGTTTQKRVVATLQARKELRIMLKQVIGEMEHAKDTLDQGLPALLCLPALLLSRNCYDHVSLSQYCVHHQACYSVPKRRTQTQLQCLHM